MMAVAHESANTSCTRSLNHLSGDCWLSPIHRISYL